MVDAGRVLFQVGIDRSSADRAIADLERRLAAVGDIDLKLPNTSAANGVARQVERSEEHTSELQSLTNLVCRLLLEKKKKTTATDIFY